MINIRPATPADLPAIKQIYDDLFSSQKENDDKAQNRMMDIDSKDLFIEKMITGKQTIILLAESFSTILGFIILEQHATPPQTYLPPYNFSYIIDLAIRRTLKQRSIISMKLINAGKNWAITHDFEYIELGI